jgi:hypothetical protein
LAGVRSGRGSTCTAPARPGSSAVRQSASTSSSPPFSGMPSALARITRVLWSGSLTSEIANTEG